MLQITPPEVKRLVAVEGVDFEVESAVWVKVEVEVEVESNCAAELLV